MPLHCGYVQSKVSPKHRAVFLAIAPPSIVFNGTSASYTVCGTTLIYRYICCHCFSECNLFSFPCCHAIDVLGHYNVICRPTQPA